MPHDGRAQAGVSEPPACEADVADTGSPPPMPEAVTSERTLTFAGVALTAVYVRLPLSGDSPATHAFRTGRPLWLNPAALTDYFEGGPTPPRAETSLAALPLAAEGGRLGCLVVVGPSMDGFEAEQRRFLERYADAVVDVLRAGTGLPAPSSPLGPTPQRLRVGSFVLTPDTGRIEADETLLERFLLTATAVLVGQALKRARAHDAEQELATMLRRSLLPRRLPELPGGTAVARYLPAERGLQVGGDWYDVIALSEDRVALVIGDVQGHSAGAATIMGQMRTAISAYAVEGPLPTWSSRTPTGSASTWCCAGTGYASA